jgi:hypothetical protein
VALAGLLLAPARASAQPTQKLHSQNTSGTITANGGSVEMLNTGGLGSLRVQSSGTYSGTWEVQCSVAPTGATPVYDTDDEVNLSLEGASSAAVQAVTDAAAIYSASIAGCTAVKAIATAWTSGTLTLYLSATTTGGSAGGGGSGSTFDGVLLDAAGGDAVTDTANDAVRVNVVAGAAAGGTSSNFGAAVPAAGTAAGFSDGTNMQAGRASDLDSGAGTEYVPHVSLRIAASGGSIPVTAAAGAVAAGTPRVTLGSDDPAVVALQIIDNIVSGSGVNVSQINGVTPLMGAGNTGTGSHRVTIAADQAGFGGAAAAMADDTANPTAWKIQAFMMCFDGTTWDRCQTTRDPCDGAAKTVIPINIVTATTTELTPSLAGASTHYYVCSINLGPTAGAQNLALVDDDTDNCASVTSGLAGGTTAGTGWNFAANGGLVLGNGSGTVAKTNGTNRVLCAVTSAAVQISGVMTVVAAP